MTDYWTLYEHFVPSEKHTPSKQAKVLQQIPRDAPLSCRYADGQAEWDVGYLKLTMPIFTGGTMLNNFVLFMEE